MAATISLEQIRFVDKGEQIQARFMNIFYFMIDRPLLESLGTFRVEKGNLVFDDCTQHEADSVIDKLVDKGLEPDQLLNTMSSNPVNYLYEGCGVPLIGSNVIGVVDRGTSLIEIKPITSCNLSCVYCSVGEGKDEKEYDFVVEPHYLYKTTKQVLEEKGLNTPDAEVEIHMSVHGEPFLYSEMLTLTKLLSSLPGVKHIATDTNGLLLNEEYVDKLADAGFTRLNFSIDSLNPEKSFQMVGKKYNHKRLVEMIEYCARHPKMDCLIAPVWMQGVNDEDIEELVQFAKRLNIVIGIQNFMNYKHGRNPQREVTWEEFREKLEVMEKKYDYKLVMNLPNDFKIYKVPNIKKTMKKAQIVDAKIMMHGNHYGERIAVANDRIITVPGTNAKIGDTIKVRITRDKHNIYYGMPIHEKVKLQDVEFGRLAP